MNGILSQMCQLGCVLLFVHMKFAECGVAYFTTTSALNDMECIATEEVFKITAGNVLHCAMICQSVQGCFSLFYQSTTKECQGCKSHYNIASVVDLEESENSKYWNKECHPGWIRFGYNCYFLSITDQNHTDAQARCYGMNSALVQIDTVPERQFLYEQVIARSPPFLGYYIDLYQLAVNGDERWFETGDIPDPNVLDWFTGQPDDFNGLQKCTMLYASYGFKWVDFPCFAKGRAICKKPLL